LETLSYSRALFVELVDCGLICGKYRGFFAKLAGISTGDLFFKRKLHGLGPWLMSHGAQSVHHEPRIGAVASSPELLLPADSGHRGQRQGGENDKGASGVRFCSLHKTERRCGGGAVRGWIAVTWSSSVACYGH
jgi:hypothetical protein